jgi:outer membrane protein assembly factor BamE (lipoprotein component of BamABCDE complex)
MFIKNNNKKRVLLAMFVLAACNNPGTAGYMTDSAMINAVQLGVADKAKVQEIMGSPSSKSSFGNETWYYVQQKTNRVAFFAPEITDQDVIAIRFNAAGVVDNIQRKGMGDSKNVAVAQDETRTEGRSITVWQQLLGNLGRYESGPRDASAPRGAGRGRAGGGN